jgi:diguanylate cyclase (GGDEF)-like protein/PAS domain S-box-containing protein
MARSELRLTPERGGDLGAPCGHVAGDALGAVSAALLASASEMVVITDGEGRLRYANGATRTVLGFDPSEMVGSSVFDYIHPEEVADAVDSLASTVARGELHAVPLELRVRAADGTWRCLEVVATNLLADPDVSGMVFSCRDLSYRRQAERRFRLMFEQSPVAQALVAPGRTGVVANAAFARMFGTTREALLETAPEMLVQPDDRPRMSEDRALLEAGEMSKLSTERRYVRADGDVFVGRTAACVLCDLDGSFEYLFVTLDDVTLQLRDSEALARSEARARALIDNSPDIIAILYPDGNWEASDQGTRLLGYPKGFDPPGGVFSLIHPEDIPDASAALAEILAGTRAPNAPIEVRLRAADGAYRQFECVGQDLGDDTHIRGVVITARDVTERKLTEAQLRAAEERFNIAFEHAPIAVSIIDLEGRIVDINAAGCEMLGYERAELIGTPAELTVHPDDRALAIQLTTAQLDGSSTPAEFRLLCSDGRVVPSLSHASLVVPTDENQQPYVISLQSDISDRKRLEEELERRASHDALTGLRNRPSLTQHLDYALRRRHRPRVAAMFIDLDDFKAVNDADGHDAGDDVLVHVADRITETLRAGDVAARLGGDEFVVVCDIDGGGAEALDIAERLRAAIAGPHETATTSTRPDITASIGVAISEPGDDSASLLRRADAAAYLAKRGGKARVELVASAGEQAPRLPTPH